MNGFDELYRAFSDLRENNRLPKIQTGNNADDDFDPQCETADGIAADCNRDLAALTANNGAGLTEEASKRVAEHIQVFRLKIPEQPVQYGFQFPDVEFLQKYKSAYQ